MPKGRPVLAKTVVCERPAWAKCLVWKHEGKAGPLWYCDGEPFGGGQFTPYATSKIDLIPKYESDGNDDYVAWYTLATARVLAKAAGLPLETV